MPKFRGLPRRKKPDYLGPKQQRYNTPHAVGDWITRPSRGNRKWSFFLRGKREQGLRFQIDLPEEVRKYRSFRRMWCRSLNLDPISFVPVSSNGQARGWRFLSPGSDTGYWEVVARPGDDEQSEWCEYVPGQPQRHCFAYIDDAGAEQEICTEEPGRIRYEYENDPSDIPDNQCEYGTQCRKIGRVTYLSDASGLLQPGNIIDIPGLDLNRVVGNNVVDFDLGPCDGPNSTLAVRKERSGGDPASPSPGGEYCQIGEQAYLTVNGSENYVFDGPISVDIEFQEGETFYPNIWYWRANATLSYCDQTYGVSGTYTGVYYWHTYNQTGGWPGFKTGTWSGCTQSNANPFVFTPNTPCNLPQSQNGLSVNCDGEGVTPTLHSWIVQGARGLWGDNSHSEDPIPGEDKYILKVSENGSEVFSKEYESNPTYTVTCGGPEGSGEWTIHVDRDGTEVFSDGPFKRNPGGSWFPIEKDVPYYDCEEQPPGDPPPSCTLVIYGGVTDSNPTGVEIGRVTREDGTCPVVPPLNSGNGNLPTPGIRCTPVSYPGDPYYETIWNEGEYTEATSEYRYSCTCPYYSGQVASLSDSLDSNRSFNSNAPYFRYQQRTCKHVMAAMRANGDLSDADVPYDETAESQFYENLNTTRYLQANPFIIPLQVCSPEYVDELMEELEETSTNPPVRDAGTDWHNWDQSQSFGKWGQNWDSAGKF